MKFYQIPFVGNVWNSLHSGKLSSSILPQSLHLPPPTTQCLRDDAPTRIEIYKRIQEECQKVPKNGDNCNVRNREFRVDGVDDVIVVGTELAHGTFGFVYRTSNPNILVKSGSVCVDRAVMAALNDVRDPIIPKEYRIVSPISESCRAETLVMQKIGDEDWFDSMNYRGKSVPLKDASKTVTCFES